MRGLLITLLVLIVIVIGVDIGARAYAESKAEDEIAARVTTRPTVDIHGFSFLVQALPGKYSQITVTSTGLALGAITGVNATVDLYDVTFPLSDAMSGDTSQLTAAQANLRATIPIDSVATSLNRPGLNLGQGDNGELRLSTTVTVAGHPIPVSADVTATFSDDALHLTVTQVRGAGIALADGSTLAKNLSMNIPLTRLPVAITAGSVTVADDQLVLTAQAANVSADDFR